MIIIVLMIVHLLYNLMDKALVDKSDVSKTFTTVCLLVITIVLAICAAIVDYKLLTGG